MIPPNVKDRMLTAIRKLIAQEFPQINYVGIWEYAVTSVNQDGSVNGSPTNDMIPLPALNNVPMGSLAVGGTSVPTVGLRFLVEFLNEGGAKYLVISCDPTVRSSTIDATDTVTIDAPAVNLGPSPSKDLARIGDSITVYMPMGLLNGLLDIGDGTKIAIKDLPMQIVNALPGLITGGTLEVQA